jgi:hypothetical protein
MTDVLKFPDQPTGFNSYNVAKILGPALGKQQNFQSYSGTDISAFIYLPLLAKSSLKGKLAKKAKALATLQTLSISSTRSVSPVRVLGRSSPMAYTRGARTIAGTLVFASVNQDVFQDIYDHDIAESTLQSSSSMLSDQLPPFSIVITAANEKGGAAIQVIHGVTLVNYGTTYSIDDLYTEVTYTYVATDVLPLISSSVSIKRGQWDDLLEKTAGGLSTLGDLIYKNMKKAYGTAEDTLRAALERKAKAQEDAAARIRDSRRSRLDPEYRPLGNPGGVY